MIMQTELINILEDNHPGMFVTRISTESKNCVYKMMQIFTDLACETIKEKNVQKIKDLLDEAAELWAEGCYEIKNAINNVFLYSLSTLMALRPEVNQTVIPLLCPQFLKELQYQQFSDLP